MSQQNRIYLSAPHMSGNETRYIKEAFDQNWIAPLGPNVDSLEKSIGTYCRVNHVAALSSGTAALHLALILLGIKPGDEVVASTFTFSATINPILYQGAIPILIDSEAQTWNMDPELLEQAIKNRVKNGNKPKAIIPVHLYGMPVNMKDILQIANYYDIPVIEDAAESLGSKYFQKPTGTFGKLAVLSFNGNKIITTSGGGALLSDNEEYIVKARFLATQARDKAIHYQHSQLGYNYRMSNVLAGIGLGQMEVIEDRVKKRRANYLFYKENLRNFEGISFLDEPDENYFSNRWLTTILIDSKKTGITRTILQQELEMKNIESRPLWKPMHLQPVFSGFPAFINNISETKFNEGLCLPSGTGLKDSDLERVLDVIVRCLKNKSKSQII